MVISESSETESVEGNLLKCDCVVGAQILESNDNPNQGEGGGVVTKSNGMVYGH